ncbi:MAG: glycosyltransferase family 2 protein [Lachnospiraceae bacterium]|nr:glycosyltransferase family 2 protein [Lachnospiraceae bacterium]
MKYISFIIPCYNSSKYMKKCIDSILPLGKDVEILIVDDGSNKDNTLEIAKKYEEKYPDICRAIHKKNGGHGDALNVGIKRAKGLFTKVVDSDDWIGKAEGKKLLATIKQLEQKKANVDLFVTNFIYDKVGVLRKKKMTYHIALPRNKVIEWDDMRFWPLGSYMLMHGLCYRTSVLIQSKLELPKHTFYVDNIYAYKPLVYVKKLYYLDVNLYHYFIGRNDQSVNEEVMIGRLDQQYRVTKIMLYDVDLKKVKSMKLFHYMTSYMSVIMAITTVFSLLSKDKHWLEEKDKLWGELKKKNKNLYNELMYSFLGLFVNLPGKVGKKMVVSGYKLMQHIYGFN